MVPEVCTIEGGVGFLPNKTISVVKEELRQAILSSGDEWLREHFELTFPKLHNDAYEIGVRLVGSEMCIRDSFNSAHLRHH